MQLAVCIPVNRGAPRQSRKIECDFALDNTLRRERRR